MATEAPLMRDGAQCVAAANYYNPASALPGPNGSGQFLAVYVSAARTVSILATQGANVYGILQNTPVRGRRGADDGQPGPRHRVDHRQHVGRHRARSRDRRRAGGHHRSQSAAELTATALGQGCRSAAMRRVPRRSLTPPPQSPS